MYVHYIIITSVTYDTKKLFSDFVLEFGLGMAIRKFLASVVIAKAGHSIKKTLATVNHAH